MAKKSNPKDNLLLFRGGVDPKDLTREQLQEVMSSWFVWMGQLKRERHLKLGHPLDDGGTMLSGRKGKRVKPFRDNKDAVGGYLLIQAANLSQASSIAKGCPILNNGGSVEVRPIMPMPGI
jgi:hypothetical protein